MDEVTYVNIPAAQYELDRTREHNTHKMLVRIIIIMAVLMAAEAVIFAWVWSLYDYSSNSIDVDTAKAAQSYIVGRDGSIYGNPNQSTEPNG